MNENPAISVIIPALNEAQRLPGLLASLVGQRWLREIIVSDGGSTDNTRSVCHQYSAIWVSPGRGKALQMNRAAERASGNILLFLHADTFLPPDALDSLVEILSNGYVAGTFRMAFDAPSPLLRFYARFTAVNSTIFTYGDQGLFLPKSMFDKVGGYPETPFLEDIGIVKRLKRFGPMGKSNVRIITSARRFKETGIISQQLLNIAIVALYHLGIPPTWLVRLYPYK